jgi:hypothetical protein
MLTGDRSVPVYLLQFFCRQALESGLCPLFFMSVRRRRWMSVRLGGVSNVLILLAIYFCVELERSTGQIGYE